MVTLTKIQTFFETVNSDDEFTGDVTETFFDGNVEIRVSIGQMNDHSSRSGSFSILLKWDGDFEDLASQNIRRVADLNPKYEELEDEFVDLIDENLGYNPYELQIDKADRPKESDFDIVFHDSVTVFE